MDAADEPPWMDSRRALPPIRNVFSLCQWAAGVTLLLMKTTQRILNPNEHPFYKEIAGIRVSAHCVIYRTGEVEQFVPFNKRAWHAGFSTFQGRSRCNDFTIGIELEGTDTLPYTDAQYEQLSKLSKFILQQYPQISLGRIVGHNDIAPGRKTDPGVAFDWPRYRQSLDLTNTLRNIINRKGK